MSSATPELEALLECREQVTVTIRNYIRLIAGFLREEGIIDLALYNQVTNPLARDSPDDRAQLVYLRLQDMVQQHEKYYKIFVNCLRKSPHQYEKTLSMLDRAYMKNGGTIAGFFVDGQNFPLPLKSSSVKAKVHGYVVGLDSTLKYVNNGDTPVEVLFRFPIDESFAVVGMEAMIEGRKVEAKIKKKEEARCDYQKATATGYTAALAEEMSGDIFSISLGNLPVYAEAELHLKLVGELPIDAEGGVRFTLPAVLKQRYTPVGSTDPLTPAGGAVKGQAPAVYDFKMAIKSEGVSDVTSPTHAISVNKGRDVINVRLSESNIEPLKKDLVVLIGQTEPHVPKFMYEFGDTSKSQCSYMGAPAVMLSFFPEFKDKRAMCEFIFLVDQSGSMRGSYMNYASEILVLFLKSIPAGCSFNIIGFGSRYTLLFPESVSYNQHIVEYAVQHAKSLQADLGGTELLSPLKYIFGQRHLPGHSRQIFVLTDGSISNTQFCIDEVAKNSDKNRVFTIGIGSGASTALVNGLAKAGGGTAEFFKEGESMQSKVIASLKRALQPSVTDLEVNFDLPSGFEAFQAPANIPTLFNGDKVVIYGILKSNAASDTPLQSGIKGKASLKGQISDETITHSISFDIPSPLLMDEDQLESSTGFDLPVIHHLAAKSLLSDWKAGKGWGSTALTQEREQESTKLSIESNVICEHTAFVAIDTEQNKPIEKAITMYDITATVAEQFVTFAATPSAPPAASNSFVYAETSSSTMALPAASNFFEDAETSSSTILTPAASNSFVYAETSSFTMAPLASSNSFEDAETSSSTMVQCGSRDSDLCINNLDCKDRSSGYRFEEFLQRMTSDKLLYRLRLHQNENGHWLLKDISAILETPEAKLQCPPDVSKDIWATIIALAFLTCKYVKCFDVYEDKLHDYEYAVMEGNQWLRSQTLPSRIASLNQKAQELTWN